MFGQFFMFDTEARFDIKVQKERTPEEIEKLRQDVMVNLDHARSALATLLPVLQRVHNDGRGLLVDRLVVTPFVKAEYYIKILADATKPWKQPSVERESSLDGAS